MPKRLYEIADESTLPITDVASGDKLAAKSCRMQLRNQRHVFYQ